jgi:hypothetical protein
VIEDAEAWPSPETSAVQDANGLSNPPVGMPIEKRIAEPDTEPDIDPRPLMLLPVSIIVSVPENEDPV